MEITDRTYIVHCWPCEVVELIPDGVPSPEWVKQHELHRYNITQLDYPSVVRGLPPVFECASLTNSPN